MTDAVMGDIYAPYIIQVGEASDLGTLFGSEESRSEAYKVIINEQVYIIRDGKKTSILGQEIQ